MEKIESGDLYLADGNRHPGNLKIKVGLHVTT